MAGLAFTVSRGWRDALQPDLSPVGVNAPRAEHPTVAVARLADYRVENDARIPEFPHHTCFLVNDFGDFLEDAERPPTVGDHLRIKEEPAVLIFRVQSLENLLMGFYANKLTGLQIERCRGCGFSYGNASPLPRELRAMPEWMKSVIEPTHRGS